MIIETWNIGIILLFLTIGTAFIGYVLPWGQIRYWGATVITNLLSAIPYFGKILVEWVWGGFTVRNATLNRFFVIHFLLPFILIAITCLHLICLHQTGSNNPLGINSNNEKIPFHFHYSIKDLIGIIIIIFIIIIIIIFFPNLLSDAENFTPANPLITPIHIKPEWYFLWAYAILRSIPNKLGGVIALFCSILILIILPFSFIQKHQRLRFYIIPQNIFWILIITIILLTWIGGCPVEPPYEFIGQILTIIYFTYYLIIPLSTYFSDKIIL